MNNENFCLEKTLKTLKIEDFHDLALNLINQSSDARILILEWIKTKKEKKSQKNDKPSPNDALLMEYWYNAQPIISEFNEYGGGPREDEEEVDEWLYKISKLIEEGNISTDAKTSFIDEAFGEYDAGNSGFGDKLMDLFFDICSTTEEWEFLVEKLEDHPSDWNNHLVMNILKNKLDKGDAYLKKRERNLHYGSDYWDLAKFYKQKNDLQKAIETCETGILKGEGRCTELFEFLFDHFLKKDEISESERASKLERIVTTAINRKNEEKNMLDKLAKYYRDTKNYDKAKQAMLKSFEFIEYQKYYDEYTKLKQFLNPSDWMQASSAMLEEIKKNNYNDYLQICLDNNMKETVLDALLNPPSECRFGFLAETINEEFAEKIKKDYPEKIIEYYWEKANDNIVHGNRKSYAVAVNYLKLARNIYIEILKNKTAWDQRFLNLKVEFKKRPTFLEIAHKLDEIN